MLSHSVGCTGISECLGTHSLDRCWELWSIFLFDRKWRSGI